MKRIFLIVLDSLGIGSSADAYKFNDVGANTFGHIAEKCFLGEADDIKRQGGLYIPNLIKLGITHAARASSKQKLLGFNDNVHLLGSYGFASEISSGKDTTSGHWELAGVPVLEDWFYFVKKNNSFPEDILNYIVNSNNITGILGNCHASGTEIIQNLGEEHIRTKKPIIYTSADSVLQIACHEIFFGLSNLYKLCQNIRYFLDKKKYKIARVIARPFIGDNQSNFQRTGNRRDFSIKPFSTTVMQKLINEKKGKVIAIGKVSDIYSGVGISKNIKSTGLNELCNQTIQEIKNSTNNTLVFTNLVDFDSNWGHRRDVIGYAKGLEFFDKKLSKIIELVKENDILILTADHGCDPTWNGTDHTRENVPILIYSPNLEKKFLGHRKTFADIGQTIAKYFLLSNMSYGKSMI
ncbi:phosphopentomutase [Buchnera aphidicola]|uniref:Phosphopentomutase n=1 Tax=Buchnera aphidicola subsp. Uroleucon sonchi TaxID=118118 RepID=A0A6C1FDY7_BUCUN|nr:phosphopentomutase [Buchnera aphidicola]QIE02216.1 phosphopentomutase [Buchnera aphidicola (Uroleucon sonchi)]